MELSCSHGWAESMAAAAGCRTRQHHLHTDPDSLSRRSEEYSEYMSEAVQHSPGSCMLLVEAELPGKDAHSCLQNGHIQLHCYAIVLPHYCTCWLTKHVIKQDEAVSCFEVTQRTQSCISAAFSSCQVTLIVLARHVLSRLSQPVHFAQK